MKKYFLILIPFIILVSLYSCDPQKDDHLIPSYIHIDSITLSSNINISEGSLSQNITDAWVYVDEQFIGTFELPATIPVLKEGDVKVMVRAGIKMNGISSTRIPYPHYTEWRSDITLTKKETVTLQPDVTYKTNLEFPWRENFERDSIKIRGNNADTVIMVVPANEAFEGHGHGKVVLEGERILYEATSDTSYVLPRNNSKFIFLELDFKTNAPVTVGVYAINPATQSPLGIVTLNRTEQWKKIYINLTNTVLNTSFATSYKIFFHTSRRPDEETTIFEVDNIKLIYNS